MTSATSTSHYNRMTAKADRCVALVAELGGDLAEHHRVLSGQTGHRARELLWGYLAHRHDRDIPDHPGKATFDTTRPMILTRIQARTWATRPRWERDPGEDIWCVACEATSEATCCCGQDPFGDDLMGNP